jgi:hypothetical protein
VNRSSEFDGVPLNVASTFRRLAADVPAGVGVVALAVALVESVGSATSVDGVDLLVASVVVRAGVDDRLAAAVVGSGVRATVVATELAAAVGVSPSVAPPSPSRPPRESSEAPTHPSARPARTPTAVRRFTSLTVI